jgi:putative membrane protein
MAADVDKARDATRRTQLANERTYLAWWRTGLTIGGLLGFATILLVVLHPN